MRAFLRVPSTCAARTPAIIFENLGVLNLSPVGRSVDGASLGFGFSLSFSPNAPSGFTGRFGLH